MRNYFEKMNTALDVLILSGYLLIKNYLKWFVIFIIQILSLIFAFLGLLSDKAHETNQTTRNVLKILSQVKVEGLKDENDNKN